MPRKGIPNYKTPTKARIKGAAEFLDHKGILYNKQELFEFNGVSKSQGYEYLRQPELADDRRHYNNLDKDKARRRPPLLTAK
ncbi:hypothetical protein GQ44DRAFT_714342 [Phaeosphaeriaceae sp. PMI808]|nr:hypothetical protein GQ44DRAFT_714342 [Phaeosphaeriaceae sp. PMI808]